MFIVFVRKYQKCDRVDSGCFLAVTHTMIAQMVRAFGMNPKVGGSSRPQVETFSVSKTFTRTSVRVSKMNAVARAQLTLQMLTLLKKYLYHQSYCSKTWDNKCLALIVQMVRAFGINQKVGGSSLPQVETIFLSQIFHKNIRSCVENECCCQRTVNTSNVNFTSKMFNYTTILCAKGKKPIIIELYISDSDSDSDSVGYLVRPPSGV